jgi:hypothetical protein
VRVAGKAILLIAVAGACSSPTQPSPSPWPIASAEPGLGHVVLLEDVVPHWGPTPGQELLDDWGEHPFPVSAGRRAVLLDGPVAGPGGAWVRAWLAHDPTAAPGDIMVWLPTTQAGRPILRFEDPPACPGETTIETVAALLPPDRARCFGDRTITIEARSWLPAEWFVYDVHPAWYGTSRSLGGAVSLSSPNAEGRPPFRPPTWVDLRVPPDIDKPPEDFVLRVTGQFGHPSASACRRARNLEGWVPRPPPGAGAPIEDMTDSERWCRWQFVATDWEIVSGPEGRPYDPARPQLHRTQFPAGAGCAGVGMAVLVVRIDPEAVDPVWIEPGGRGRSLAFFGPEFQLVLGPPARVVGPNGLVLADGDRVDPDRGMPNLAVCPGGEVVSFLVPPG